MCLFLISQLLFGPLLQAQTLPYRLVDTDQYDIFEEEQKAKAEKELQVEEAPDDAQLLKYTNDFWRQAVTAVEGDYILDKEPEPIPDLTLLNPTLSLPLYGTNVALTGRYMMGFQLNSKKYRIDKNNDVGSRNVRNMEMLQEMKLKMQGKILDRVFVDIDYDDKREDEKNISVAYRGKPGELVQLAEFGDINLSLPQTEFIAYEKQLFGAKMHLQHKNLDLNIIGSQTKGSSKQKQFIGRSVFEIVSVKDKDYIRRTYYDLTFGSNTPVGPDSTWNSTIGSIAPGSESIYIDTNTTATDYVPVTLTAKDWGDSSVTYTSKFKLLTRGVDYTVDYGRGTIRFAKAQTAASVIAVNYRNNAGAWLSPNQNEAYLIKTENEKNMGSGSALGWQMEIKRFYSVGAQQITRDNGKGNFTLHLLDANGQEVGNLASPKQVYPSSIDMDFDQGVFELQQRMNDDAGLYNVTPVSSKNRLFQIEYVSAVKTYFIEPGIVVQSEAVKLNGRPLQRNNDYYIDYTSGYITFYKADTMDENAVIDVTYDTTDGSNSNNSIIGGRLDYKVFDKVRLGATLLKEGGDTPDTVPQVGSYGKDLLVYGADVNAKDVKVAPNMSVDFGAEMAKSRKKENAFGYAMIDSMNETNIQTGGSMVFYDWTIAANPNGKPAFLDSLQWDTQELPSLEINPNAIGTYNEKQQVLVINYDFTQAVSGSYSDEISLVYPLSSSGVDLSDKTSFTLTMLGEGSSVKSPQVNIAFSNISEYSDAPNPVSVPNGLIAGGYGMYTACSPDTAAPKTEDVNCLSTLAPNEDVGWWFANPDGTLQRFNPFVHNPYNPQSQPNGRIDSQDLNRNGKYDEAEPDIGGNFGYAPTNEDAQIASYLTATHHSIDDPAWPADNTLAYDGWKTFTTPLHIAEVDKAKWTAVRHLRITLKLTDEMKAAGRLKGTIKIANVALAGTVWNPQQDIDPAQFAVSGINNVDNADYQPIFAPNSGDGLEVFNYLYGSLSRYREQNDSVNVRDQSLNMTFNTLSVDDESLYANRNFTTMDFTQHRQFRFLLHSTSSNAGSEFFMKVGTDANYDKITVPLDFDGWRLISVKMVDANGDGITDQFTDASDPAYGVRVSPTRAPGGIMNFKKISMIMAGVEKETDDNGNFTGTGSQGEVWLNTIHLADAVVTEGSAYKVDGVVRLDGWGSAGAKYKHMDSNFETPLVVAKNQEVTEEEYFLKVNRIKYFPMQATLNRSTVVTPAITDTTNYNTVSSLDKGSVERQQANIRGDFIKDNLPKVGLQYTLDQVDYDLMRRKDTAQTYGVSVSHTVGTTIKNLNAGYSYTDTEIRYARAQHLASDNIYNTQEQTQRVNMKFSYEPHKNFTITPSYSLSQSKEDRLQHFSEADVSHHYPKAMNQNAGFNSTWRIAKWFAPAFSYNIATTEVNNLTEKKLKMLRNGIVEERTFDIGQLKSVNRSADGGVSLTLSGNELLPNNKLFKSLVISSSYRLQDADSWYYIDDDFNAKDKLWVRSRLKGNKGDYASRQNLVLRDTFTSSQRWTPFSGYEFNGALAPIRTISLLNNFTQSIQRNNQTGTEYEMKSLTLPDMVFSISDLEKSFHAGQWLSSTNLKLRYSAIKNVTVGSSEGLQYKYGGDLRFLLFNKFDTVLIYDRQTSDQDDLQANRKLEASKGENLSAQTSFYWGNWRFTPKVLYATKEKRIVSGQLSESYKEWVPSLAVRLDFNLPRGVKLPFINRMYNATNRVIWNTVFSYKDRSSPVEVKDNYHSIDVTSSVDYEVSQNLRLNMGGGVSWLTHAYVKTEDYVAYNLAANLTIQF